MKESELVINIPRAFIARCRREETAFLIATREEFLQDSVALCTRIAEVVAFVDEDKIAVPIANIFREQLPRILFVATQEPRGEDLRAEAVGGVIGFPHRDERGRTEDERTRLCNLFKVLDNRRTDVTFA